MKSSPVCRRLAQAAAIGLVVQAQQRRPLALSLAPDLDRPGREVQRRAYGEHQCGWRCGKSCRLIEPFLSFA